MKKLQTDGQKLELALEYLWKIALFGHDRHCSASMAPVYECGCYEKDQWDLAEEAYKEITGKRIYDE